MSEPKWTPGPWFLINPHCVGGPVEPGWEEAGQGVAHCGMRARTRTEAEANARLIAASPAMAEALEKAIPVLLSAHENDASVVSWAALESARAALKLAKGE